MISVSNSSRFVTLDAFRGIAAIIVVLFHAGIRFDTYVPRFGYLAVDLFFLLSGFVLARAYDRRLAEKMGIFEFIYLRIVRLYPLFLLGLVLGSFAAFLNMDIANATLRNIGIDLGFNVFGLPSPTNGDFQASGYRFLFPLNIPFWSIFAEFWIANLVYALLTKLAGNRVLAFLVAISCVGLILNEHAVHTIDVGGNWFVFIGLFPRVGYSFLCGVLISRMVLFRVWRVPAWCLTIALIAILCLPLEGKSAHLFELTTVIILFPILIYLGTAATEQYPRIGEVLGDASYPLYAVHFPLLAVLRWVITTTHFYHGKILPFCFAAGLLPLACKLGKADTSFRRWLLTRLPARRSVSAQ
jgi:peptidoglycan/LPS O-acetylase OafA/YrhL